MDARQVKIQQDALLPQPREPQTPTPIAPSTNSHQATEPPPKDTIPVLESHPPAPAAIPTDSPTPPAHTTQTGWQELPPSAPWAPPEIAAELGFQMTYEDQVAKSATWCQGWNVVAATRRGRMHAHNGGHREDAFAFESHPDFGIACVSDGAGAARLSRIGSEFSARSIVKRVADFLKTRSTDNAPASKEALESELRDAIGTAVQETCVALSALALKAAAQPKDFRCTLLLAVLWLRSPEPLLFFSQVGDGLMATRDSNGGAQRHGQSDSGEFSGEVTCFLPDSKAPEFARRILCIPAATLQAGFLGTDGIEDPFYPANKYAGILFDQFSRGVSSSIEGFVQPPSGPVIAAADGAHQLQTWLGFERRGENDDRTLLVFHRASDIGRQDPLHTP